MVINTARVREIIAMALGEASMGWEPTPTGVFQSQEASRIVGETIANLERLFDGEVADGPETQGGSK